ncbi:MAG: hypothetical protein J7480_04965 [Microbacteriaceae bacterium]|nr:hypothetical protein [Microbacteriaceae bacterium]
MAEAASKKTEPAAADDRTFTPTAASKRQSTRLRVIAWILWIVAIAAEAVGIFWVLRQRETTTSSGQLVRNPDTGLLEPVTAPGFPQWAFIVLIVLLVVIAALSITGSFLWKKANRLDPASAKDKVRFFVQNQLGAIVAIVAFLPLIIMVFLNKDMSGSQKTIAGIIGIVLAAGSVALGADFNPPSQEAYSAEKSTVIQLLGADSVAWAAGGEVYHVCPEVSDLANANAVSTGTVAEAIAAGKPRLTLELRSELTQCGKPVPDNVSEITDAIRAIRDGAVDTVLPAPVWPAGVEAPFTPAEPAPAAS